MGIYYKIKKRYKSVNDEEKYALKKWMGVKEKQKVRIGWAS